MVKGESDEGSAACCGASYQMRKARCSTLNRRMFWIGRDLEQFQEKCVTVFRPELGDFKELDVQWGDPPQKASSDQD
ncbi:hypothetical protein [Sinorhizobium mexicanum]|uniref:hypothetical protein n=1 Tax=Sinorhizobium mexicanum TaxID=375549 RepID=UPI0015DE362D|nr:hypothetical protein [Sinorhizobium mexicanum]MBP1887994.1 ABC-type Zn2+ transport system substrate-binding protein/surface adhesin [Sinorhizobium mexicanum]